MSLYHDIKYVQLLAPHLERFHRKGDYLWNCKCKICGDSKKKQNKARGYIYRRKNDLFYKCHNCGIGLSLGNFIKHVNQALYDQYVIERYSQGETNRKPHSKLEELEQFKPQINKITSLGLPSLLELPKKHVAVQYMLHRKISTDHLALFYYAENFQEWAMKITDNQYKSKYHIDRPEPRIVIPFLDRAAKLVAIQGRALLNSPIRYITLKFNPNAPKIFGLERWNHQDLTYVVEGPIDSLFLPNCLAMAGSSVDASKMFTDKKNVVFLYDFEPRNIQITNQMYKVAKDGYGLVIMPDKYLKYKDINEVILSGVSQERLLKDIKQNTFYDLEAILRLSVWKK